jgi:hypothetical protein
MSPSLDPLDMRAFASNLPGTFDLTIYSTDTDMVATHDILVTAWMGIYSDWGTTKTITITIVDACLTTPITVPTTFGPDQYYWYTKPQITRPVDDFVPDLPYCAMSYSLANQDGSGYDGAVISEDLASLVMQLNWETSDKAKVGDYPLRVTGGYKTNTLYFDLVLHVIDPCITATRAVAQPYWLDVEYDILAPELTFTWSDAAVSVNETICGDWEYELLFQLNNTAIADSGTSIHVDYTAKLFQV